MSGKSLIDKGVPCIVAHFDKDGIITHTEHYNLENYRPPDWAIESFARAILPDVQSFFADPKNQAEYEKWEADRTARGMGSSPPSQQKKERK